MSSVDFSINQQDWQNFQDDLQKLETAETENFIELAELLGLNVKTDFVGADLRNTDLSNLDLRDVDFSYTNLQSADLSFSDLSNANLSNTNLSNTNLSHANLSNTNLSNTDLSNANLSNTNLESSNLSGTIGIESLSTSFRRECLRRWLEGEVVSQWKTVDPQKFRGSVNINKDPSSRYRITSLSDFSIVLKASFNSDKLGYFSLNLSIYPLNSLEALPAGLQVSVIDENATPYPDQTEELTQPIRQINLLVQELAPGEEFGIQIRFEDAIFVENFVV